VARQVEFELIAAVVAARELLLVLQHFLAASSEFAVAADMVVFLEIWVAPDVVMQSHH
jgi:hypothetical protein